MADIIVETQEENSDFKLETGAYEIIRNRLTKHSKELQTQLNTLNAERKRIFGSIDFSLIATERIITDNACIPADMEPIGHSFIFGYNVATKLKDIDIADVFSIYSYENHLFHKKNLDLISDEKFIYDFNEMYKYYKNTRFAKFAVVGTSFFMIFRISKGIDDIKAFKWDIIENELQYVDDRSAYEFKFPKQHEFKWTKTNRDMYVEGKFPHISIDNQIFVETTEGDLTIKIENNTNSGDGIYTEDVLEKSQTLDDAEFHYSILGNIIILRIRPYQEKKYRHIVYNSKTQTAERIDAISEACVLLPDNHGIIFSHGYYLQTGEFKFFEKEIDNLVFEKRIVSPNGEDYLYTFYEKATGVYVLMTYNLIEQKIDTPIICNGFSIFDNGEMCYFRSDGESKKHHVIQIWRTTFVHADYDMVVEKKSYIYKLGNKDIVKAMSECFELLNLAQKKDSYTNLYVDIVKKAANVIDSYYWIGHKDAYELSIPLQSIKDTASSAIDEYEKVVKIKQNTKDEIERVSSLSEELLLKISRNRPTNINNFVEFLADLRKLRGELISSKELRYINVNIIESYENKLEEKTNSLSEDCVRFLLQEDSLTPYYERVEQIREDVDNIGKVVDANKINDLIAKVSQELEMLIEIVSNLKIEDATQTAKIIDNISSIYSNFNQIKAALRRKRKELLSIEGKAEFTSQIKLISQSVINYLDLCDTTEKTDEYLTKLLVQLEELEGKFSEFDEFISEIMIKREEIHNAFELQKLQLIERRNKRASTLQQSANRILKSVNSKIKKFETVSEINGYYASDLMIDKIRSIVKQLLELNDSVKVDEIQSKLKTVKEDAIRQLKDKADLYVSGKNIIKFGNHQFTVNTQPLGLSMVHRDRMMYYHLSGTGFYEKVENEEFNILKEFWGQNIVSENKKVYRAEYLAYKILIISLTNTEVTFENIKNFDDEQLLEHIQKYMSVKYSEGYVKGIHDHDAMMILKSIVDIRSKADLLRYSSVSRACAETYWKYFIDKKSKASLQSQLKGTGLILNTFPTTKEFEGLIKDIENEISNFIDETKLFDSQVKHEAAEYLFYELSRGNTFVISKLAIDLYNKFANYLKVNIIYDKFYKSVELLHNSPLLQYKLIRNWVKAYINNFGVNELSKYTDEVVISLMTASVETKITINANLELEIEGLEGSHSLIKEQKYMLKYNEFMLKMYNFENTSVPDFKKYQDLKKSLTVSFEDDLRLNEFKPRVMSSFVRNKLIDKVYLHLIGNNLAKQIGTAGEGKRTDLMGLLLLISPPGYGKTTLMEYIASRLGIIFMKINGPALGHEITSVDPNEATNATSKEELEKLNLAFEIGDNVMIYLDDIQHCNPEFLQKFISLSDGQRKIEGIYKGKSKTYDFRGKKVCIIMAGNPYTESGDKFQIPDMLANRADIYNLGDILGDTESEFLLSYIENSLTSNSVLGKLSGKSQKDIYSILQIVETNSREGIDFESNHTSEELNEYISVFKKLITVRDVISKVNQQYIYSAAQSDEYRVEPSFKLQGSYRNMNKLSEKILPIMNDAELETLILAHYESESQTLTTGAEANLLKFKEIIAKLSDKEKERWEHIKDIFLKNKKVDLGGQIKSITKQMEAISDGLNFIGSSLKK